MYTSYESKPYYDAFLDAFFGKDDNVGHLPMKTDIYESEKAYRLDMDLPGISKDEITVDFKDGYLTVTVKTAEKEEKEFHRVRRERFYGETSRRFYLGDEVDEENIGATFHDGVLSILLAKAQPVEPNTRRIEIK